MSGLPSDAELARARSAVELRREAYAMALYVAICLLAALIATPASGAEAHVFEIIWGITVGLALAHFFAFRVSARLMAAGKLDEHDSALAGAQVAGAAVVALLATIPVIVLPESAELVVVEIMLSAFIGLAGFAVARGGGASRIRALAYALVVIAVAVGIAVLKNSLAAH
jgi:hypothetical protein